VLVRHVPILAVLAVTAVTAAVSAHAATRTVAARVPYATNVTFDGKGRMWITSAAAGPIPSGGVWMVPAKGAKPRHVVKGINVALGLAWQGTSLFVAHVTSRSNGRVSRYDGFTGTGFRRKRVVVPRLPIGRHTVDSIAAGPDGRLYLGVGSEYDNRASSKKLSATVVSFRPDGSGLKVVARGLRNPFGLAFIPGTRLLLVTDNGRDDLGPDRPPEELNLVDTTKAPRHYGFPGCYGQGGSACKGKVSPIVDLPPHASSDGLAVTPDWDGEGLTAFVAQNGSTIRPQDPTGRDIVKIALRRRDDGTYTGTATRFAGPFALRDPLGAATGPDGALYVTQFRSGRVDRFTP